MKNSPKAKPVESLNRVKPPYLEQKRFESTQTPVILTNKHKIGTL
jgi:hypothetical protein